MYAVVRMVWLISWLSKVQVPFANKVNRVHHDGSTAAAAVNVLVDPTHKRC